MRKKSPRSGAHPRLQATQLFNMTKCNCLKLGLMAPLALLWACSGMSEQETQMVGKYYIPALSDTRPLLELNPERKAVIRAIRPGELSFYVEGLSLIHI